LIPSFKHAFGYHNQVRIVIDSKDSEEAPRVDISPDEMKVTGAFTMRIKNPTYNEYDAVQIKCSIKMNMQAVLEEKFMVTGKINDIAINVTQVQAFYYEEEEDKKTLEET